MLFRLLRRFYEQALLPVIGDIRPILSDLREGFVFLLNGLGGLTFRMTECAGKVRWLLITLLCALMWAWLAGEIGKNKPLQTIQPSLANAQVKYISCVVRFALVADENKYNRDQRCESLLIGRSFTFNPFLFEIPFLELFSADVLRRVLLMAFGCWLAYKAMARYQAEVYAAPAPCAEHFILQAAAINPYNILNIQDSDVAPGQAFLPVQRIGGPGYVCVHLENAALFERMDGSPRVIGPTVNLPRQLEVLGGFERLRKSFLLRDHIDRFDVQGRSLDGIRVRAERVEVNFSVYRDEQPATFERPYPFQDPAAIINLVYRGGTGPWFPAALGQVQAEFGDFLARNTLNEFLAMIGRPEINPATTPAPPNFVARDQISADFLAGANRRAIARGAQINWLNVGTWRPPAQVFDRRHQDAWRITLDNAQRSAPAALTALSDQQRLAEIARLIQSAILAKFRDLGGEGQPPAPVTLAALVNEYLVLSRRAIEGYDGLIADLNDRIQAETDPILRQNLTVQRDGLIRERGEIDTARDRLWRFAFTV